MKIKTISSTRWRDYKNLRLEALKDCPVFFGSSYNDEKRLKNEEWKKRLESEFSDTLFAVDEKNILIGMITALYNPKETQNHVSTIVSFYVKEEHRGIGIGKKLLKDLVAKIKEKKHIKKIKIQAAKINIGAIKLYEKAGFKHVGILKKEIRIKGKYYDDILMEKLF